MGLELCRYRNTEIDKYKHGRNRHGDIETWVRVNVTKRNVDERYMKMYIETQTKEIQRNRKLGKTDMEIYCTYKHRQKRCREIENQAKQKWRCTVPRNIDKRDVEKQKTRQNRH